MILWGQTLLCFLLVYKLQLLLSISTQCCRSCVSDCQDVMDIGHVSSGVQHVYPHGTHSGYDVYCDMETDGGGWLVFQRRNDGSVDFYKDWNAYARGFGNISHEHWLGLYPLRRFVTQGQYELRVDVEDWDGSKSFAKYHEFSISDSTQHFKLTVAGYEGTAGDSLSHHNGQLFSTLDKDNDEHNKTSCAQEYRGGWWYHHCYHTNLNGLHENGTKESIVWVDPVSLRAVEMKIRRV